MPQRPPRSLYKRRRDGVEISGHRDVDDLLRLREQRYYWSERLLRVILAGTVMLVAVCQTGIGLLLAVLPFAAWRWMAREKRRR